MTIQDFENEIYEEASKRPKFIRFGQFVFNYLYKKYPLVVEKVQFEDMVDCYYRDDMVCDFISRVYERINNR